MNGVDPNGNADFTSTEGEFHGVAQEIKEDLLESVFITDDVLQIGSIALFDINVGLDIAT